MGLPEFESGSQALLSALVFKKKKMRFAYGKSLCRLTSRQFFSFPPDAFLFSLRKEKGCPKARRIDQSTPQPRRKMERTFVSFMQLQIEIMYSI